MFLDLVKRLFGSVNDRTVRLMRKDVARINELEPKMAAFSDAELQQQTKIFKDRLAAGETVDDLLVEAFACVREASRRVLNMRHFDVQLIGGMVLHKGMITEMKTGEGKTLVATLAVYLNALEGKGVHVVTVNDYLAQRDSSWMGQLYRFLGLSVGCIVHGLDDGERKAAYNCDITYATNNELGFDYLRDNMKFRMEDMAHRPFHYAVVDEVDSILIDEARTPLIISGPAEDSSELYTKIDKLIPLLGAEDFEKDEKSRNVTLTESGVEKIEQLVQKNNLLQGGGLYDIQNISVVHHVNQALRAHKLFTRDVDYIVKDRKVIIIDEFTGRMMEGRRYSEGLHQALEAKENVPIQVENQTLASITFQNFFRMYPKLSGMTGTAMTEATEFSDIYKLEVVEVPTNLPCVRHDYDDEVYRTGREKHEAIIKLIEECRAKQQPVLVGTVSIEKSEQISNLLKARGITHNVLNARHHDMEAYIIAQAGYPGAITIATNMAGRGTDIKLGGNVDMLVDQEVAKHPELAKSPAKLKEIHDRIEKTVRDGAEIVRAAGGLYVIGTERHESRRIDNQLRGRAGRQSDPGASKFFLSLEDDLMRIFGSERLDGMLQKLGLQEGEAIVHRWINKALERAQRKVEARNYDIRKQLLRFDDVMNDQRKVIYEQRRELMGNEDISETLLDMRLDVIDSVIMRSIPQNTYAENWDAKALHEECLRVFGIDLPFHKWVEEDGITETEVLKRVTETVEEHLKAKENKFGSEMMRFAEKNLLLRILDQLWKEHLLSLDHLRQGISLRAYGQRDPLNEYKSEAFNLFNGMISGVKEQIISALCHLDLQVSSPKDVRQPQAPKHVHESRNEAWEDENLPGSELSGKEVPTGFFPFQKAPSIRKKPRKIAVKPIVVKNESEEDAESNFEKEGNPIMQLTTSTSKSKRKSPLLGKKVAKKATASKATAKKTTAKKTTAKKAAPKKVAAKKMTVASASAKKTTVKKAATSKVAAKKTTVKKVAAKKTAVKKAAPSKVTAKKTVAKKVTAKKTAAKKVTAKKAVAKKAPAKKVAAKKATTKKASSSRKTASKK